MASCGGIWTPVQDQHGPFFTGILIGRFRTTNMQLNKQFVYIVYNRHRSIYGDQYAVRFRN
jgi:hypothetical protein